MWILQVNLSTGPTSSPYSHSAGKLPNHLPELPAFKIRPSPQLIFLSYCHNMSQLICSDCHLLVFGSNSKWPQGTAIFLSTTNKPLEMSGAQGTAPSGGSFPGGAHGKRTFGTAGRRSRHPKCPKILWSHGFPQNVLPKRILTFDLWHPPWLTQQFFRNWSTSWTSRNVSSASASRQLDIVWWFVEFLFSSFLVFWIVWCFVGYLFEFVCSIHYVWICWMVPLCWMMLFLLHCVCFLGLLMILFCRILCLNCCCSIDFCCLFRLFVTKQSERQSTKVINQQQIAMKEARHRKDVTLNGTC